MFIKLLGFEIKDRLFRRSSLVYFIVYFTLAFFMAITFAGAFKNANVNFGFSNKLAMNSPIIINLLTSMLGFFGLLMTAPLFGQLRK